MQTKREARWRNSICTVISVKRVLILQWTICTFLAAELAVDQGNSYRKSVFIIITPSN